MSKLRILHVTPHLGGGVGRCLSALCLAGSDDIDREFMLLEAPIDTSFYDIISQKHPIYIVDYKKDLDEYLTSFDIVQCEFWNHPAMLHFLNFTKNIELNRIFWCHVSGLGVIRFPTSFLNSDNNVVFTSQISNTHYGTKYPVVNSGFVFPEDDHANEENSRAFDFVFAGQLDYTKLHPEFTGIIDGAASLTKSFINILGDGKDAGAIKDNISSQNVIFHGHVSNVRDYLKQSKFLIYPLNEKHYGTGENVVKEAMSLGCLPLLISNPAEMEIMQQHKKSFCHDNVTELIHSFSTLVGDEQFISRYSRLLKDFAAQNYTAELSVNLFKQIYRETMNRDEPRAFEMVKCFGQSPLEWFEAFGGKDRIETGTNESLPNKGSLVHFKRHFSQGEAILGMNYEN